VKEVEGNKFYSKVMKKSGAVVGRESSHEGSVETAFQDFKYGLPEVAFDSGRTIALKQFEFCRVKLGIRLRYDGELDRSSVRTAAKTFIREMLKREELAVTNPGEKYVPDVDQDIIDILNSCVGRSIRVSYGLTLQTAKKYESEQADTGEELPIDDGADIFLSFEALSDMLAEEIADEHRRIKGGPPLVP